MTYKVNKKVAINIGEICGAMEANSMEIKYIGNNFLAVITAMKSLVLYANRDYWIAECREVNTF